MRNKIVEKFKELKIGTKIIVCYFIISVISITFSTIIYQKINERIMTKKVSEIALQTLQTIDNNLNLLVYTVNNESKILISNQGLQEILRNEDKGFDYYNQIKINRNLTEFIQSNKIISSIYIFDNYGNRYFVDKKTFKSFGLCDIKNSSWYNELQEAQGGYIVKLTGKELFNQTDQRYVSIARVINDLDTQKPIGTMIINISEEEIVNCFKNIMVNSDTTIQLKNENNKDIIHSKGLSEYSNNKNFENKKAGDNYYSIQRVKGKDYITSYLKNNLNWTIISVIPYNEISNQLNIYMVAVIAMLILNGIMSFSGLILTSSGITRPIDKLIKSMEGVEKGDFRRVNIETGNDEIGKLKNVYNTMIFKIENLIEQIVKEQKIKRKAELDVLQSQIKPHFLYNSFDAISSLSLDNRNDEVYKIIKALGNFYRTSLSNGKEVIYIEEELQTVKSYITIMQIRYNNMFSVSMDIDKRASKYKILKLILQPLVENSIYHGIKPKKARGNIFVGISLKDDYVEIIVFDDGVGMSNETLKTINDGITKGIGLKGTMERLFIFYNGKSKFEVRSKKGEGTKVIIHIPLEQEENCEH